MTSSLSLVAGLVAEASWRTLEVVDRHEAVPPQLVQLRQDVLETRKQTLAQNISGFLNKFKQQQRDCQQVS